MIDSQTPITGVVETDNRTYAFYLNDYSVKYMDTVITPYYTSTVKPVDGFIRATSHNNHKMLMYVGQNDFPIVNAMNMGISSYIVSSTNVLEYDISFYDGILFVGGTLAKLKHPRGMKIEYDTEQERDYIHYCDDEQKFSFSTDGFNCDVAIGSNTTEHYGNEGRFFKNGEVYLKMSFDKSQKTSSIYRHYSILCEILSFLTNRKNVGVEKIFLLQKDVPIGETKTSFEIAQVFIKQEKEQTQKQQYQNLEFECLGESTGKLFEIFYKTQDKKRSYSLGFYPEDDKKGTLITNEKVRLVCSALECELSFVKKIENEEKEKINALKEDIKPIIEKHKTSSDRLRDKTYSLIESSMSHWTTAAADQFKALYHMFEEEMAIANQSNRVIGEAEIEAFVKYRNDITHGSYRVLDSTIAYTTYLMTCLVYCCFLTRIGINRERIRQWFYDGRLLS